VYKCDVV